MRPLILFCFCAVFATGCTDKSAEKSLADAKSRIAALETEAATQQAAMADVQTKLATTSAALTDSNEQVENAKSILKEYDAQLTAMQSAYAERETRRKLIESVPATNITIFPLVLSPTGQPLMTNGEYVRILGRGLRFKCGTDLEVFDVDDVHPSILARLGIDAEQAKKNEAELKEAKARFYGAIGAQAAKTQAAQAEWQEKWNKEQASILAAQQAQAAASAAQWQSMPKLSLPRSKYQRIGFGM